MSITDKMPKYTWAKKQMVFNVVFTALFSLMAMLLMAPFSISGWFQSDATTAGLLTICFWAFGFAFLAFSRSWLYRLQGKEFTFLGYVTWCLVEMIIISACYSACSYWGIEKGWINDPLDHPGVFFCSALVFCLFGMGAPNVISLLWFAVSERDQTIRLMNFNNVVSDTQTTPRTDKKIMLYDNSGVLKLIINQDSIFYIESDDNYIKVWYEDSSEEIKQYMLRCRLKTIEESFADSELVRCHRQYIVNINKVERVTRQKDGLFQLDLGNSNIAPIPVSKTYENGFIARFNSR